MSLSVIIPARNEQFLERTIRDVLQQARGEIEVIAILDGYLPEPPINIGDSRVTFYAFRDSIGQRAAINYGVAKAKGEFVMKLDAHCAVAEGFDVALAADCERDWTVIPRMYNLDVESWKPKLHKRTDYMYIGLRENGELRSEYYEGQEYRKQHRKPDLIDDTMGCMGPGFFMRRDRFLELDGCDENHGSWGQQGIEVACKAWLSGGRLVVNKKTWFAHWFRGGGGPGFPYPIRGRDVGSARSYSKDLWLNNKWPKAVRKFDWLIEKFHPPGWSNGVMAIDPVEEQVNLLNRRIREVFGVSVRGDFSPIGTRHGTRDDLPGIWHKSGYRVGAEIGVQRAVYASRILRDAPDVHLHCIDPWLIYNNISKVTQDRNYSIAMERLKPFVAAGRCTIHREFSQKIVDRFEDGSLDFLHIDGDHTFDACARDLINFVPKVRRGGMIVVHDYMPMRRGGVVESVDGYTKCNLIAPWFVIREAIPTAFWVKTR